MTFPQITGIITEEISVSYGRHPVLRDVSLHLKGGAVITLLGPNGCGKTTLLKVINGLLHPSSGAVYVDGRSLAGMRQREIARIMGYVPQSQRSSFPFSSLDIVLTGRLPHISALAQPGPEDMQKAREALDMVGASHLIDRPYTQISGGERQLVMIARALAQEPSVLLLDEPTSYLDFKNQIQTLKMVKEISRSKEVTVIMTLHDPNHALMFSDDVVLLRKLNGSREGNVISFGSPDEVMTPKNIQAAYGVQVEIVHVKGRKILMPL